MSTSKNIATSDKPQDVLARVLGLLRSRCAITLSPLHSPRLARAHDHGAHRASGAVVTGNGALARVSVCCECSFVLRPDRVECGVRGQALVA